MGTVNLKTASGGSVILSPANTAVDVTITVPAVTAGLVNDSANLLNIGSGQVVKDASGNLGLGVTPSAWISSAKALQFLSVTSVSQQSNGTANFQHNAYEGSTNSYNYIVSAGAGRYNISQGQHSWYNAPSGTAGAAITFTQAMTLDASGRLFIGTSSPIADTAIALVRGTSTSWGVGPSIVNGNGNNFYVLNSAGTGAYIVSGGTSWTANSDERLKTTLIPFTNAAAKVCTIRAGTGRYLTDEDTVSRSFLIAQDVLKVLPEAVNVQADEMGTLGVQYTDLIPLLISAIQEQQALITQLQADVAALKGA